MKDSPPAFLKARALWEHCESSESADRLEGKNRLQGMSYGRASLIAKEVSIDVNSPGTAICYVAVETVHILHGEEKDPSYITSRGHLVKHTVKI